jgi:integrase
MQDTAKIAKQLARILRKAGVDNYDQTKHIFRQVRQELDLSPPKRRARGTVKRMSTENLRAFLTHAQRHSAERGLIMTALYETAVRVAEFTNLRVEDFFFEQRRIIIRSGKGDKRREVPLTSELANALRIYLASRSEGPLFRSRLGKAYTTRRIQQLVDEVSADASILTRVTPHTLRHTRATLLIEAGMTRDELRQMLGHEKSDTTDVYTRTAAVLTAEAYDQATGVLGTMM